VSEETPPGMNYAWNWFSLHAGQRLQMVSFWLVAISFLTTAYVEAVKSELGGLARAIALLGGIVSIVFALLDARTRSLVRVAEKALAAYETLLITSGEPASVGLTVGASNGQQYFFQSYRILIQSVESIASVAFLVAALKG
jgi:hypothetical protein